MPRIPTVSQLLDRGSAGNSFSFVPAVYFPYYYKQNLKHVKRDQTISKDGSMFLFMNVVFI